MSNRGLYTGVLAGLIGLVTLSAGSGLWNRPADYGNWQYRMFQGVCHQLPDRTIQLNGERLLAVGSACRCSFQCDRISD